MLALALLSWCVARAAAAARWHTSYREHPIVRTAVSDDRKEQRVTQVSRSRACGVVSCDRSPELFASKGGALSDTVRLSNFSLSRKVVSAAVWANESALASVRRQAFDLQFRWRLRLVETGVEASGDGECLGKPRTVLHRLSCPKSKSDWKRLRYWSEKNKVIEIRRSRSGRRARSGRASTRSACCEWCSLRPARSTRARDHAVVRAMAMARVFKRVGFSK